MAGRRTTLTCAIAAGLVAVIWLAPPAVGPLPGVNQWLTALVAAALLSWLVPAAVPGLPLLGASCLLAALASMSTSATWGAIAAAAMLASACFRFGRAAASHSRWSSALAWGLVVAAGATLVLSLIQVAGGADALRGWVAGNTWYGNLRQRNQFASLSVIGLSALLWFAASRPVRPGLQHDAWTQIGIVIALLLGLANGLAGSRTGAMQLVLLALMCAWWGMWRLCAVRWLMGAATVGLGLASVYGHLYLSQASALSRLVSEEVTCASRWVLWQNVWDLIQQRPWWGWGWGELDFAHYDALYAGERFCDILDNAHNLPLHIAVELGVPAATILILATAGFVLMQRPWSEQNPTRRLAWSCLALIGLHSMLEYPLWYPPFMSLFAMALGILAGERAVVPTVWRRVSVGLLPACMLACAVYGGVDYRRVSQLYIPVRDRLPAYQEDAQRKLADSWLFADQVQFAELVTTEVTLDNAMHVRSLALHLLHFSPEPRVIERLLDSAWILEDASLAHRQEARFARAFPQAYDAWKRRLKRTPTPR